MKNLFLAVAFVVLVLINLSAQEMNNARQITFNPAREGFPSWSPDGKYIVYQYTDMTDTQGKNGLWRISSDGTETVQIFKGIAEHPKWSPDGHFIVFDADTGKSTKMIPAEGGDPIIFLPDTIHINKGGLPCWSPDAIQIAFKDHENYLCIYNRKTGETRRVFNKEGKLLLPGCWSPDGKYVWISLMDRQSKKSNIWKISYDGKVKKQITGHHENIYRYLALSPDNSLLLYAAKEGKYLGFYIMFSNGGPTLPFALSPDGHNEAPVWSPDGKKIAFSSFRGWNVDIWIMDVDLEHIKRKLHEANE